MVLNSGNFRDRRAPYAPISALGKFFERIRDRSVPELVDHTFLKRLGVASNNEYALLSALKFLEIVDDRGRPTHAYRLLQSPDRFQDTLKHLVETAYHPVFEEGAQSRPLDELIDFFRLTSSPSQAKNAARFFLAVCRLAGIEDSGSERESHVAPPTEAPATGMGRVPPPEHVGADDSMDAADTRDVVLRAKATLLEKLPPVRPEWSAAEYRAICDRFLEMLRNLDETE